MKKTVIMALVAGFALPLGTAAFAAGDTPSPADNDPNRINVSCYRGLLKTVAWDRPNAVFIEDLRQLGYTYEEAHVIGERVCRDEYGVDDGAYKINLLKKILRETPPRR